MCYCRCQEALDLNKHLITEEQHEYQHELVRNFRDFQNKLEPMVPTKKKHKRSRYNNYCVYIMSMFFCQMPVCVSLSLCVPHCLCVCTFPCLLAYMCILLPLCVCVSLTCMYVLVCLYVLCMAILYISTVCVLPIISFAFLSLSLICCSDRALRNISTTRTSRIFSTD